MAPEFAPTPTDLDGLRHELARHGVSLFEHTPAIRGPSPSVAELAGLVVALAESKDARLGASIPCLLAAFASDTARAVAAAAALARPAHGAPHGWRYRQTRALVNSRRPDLERLFGAISELRPSDLEPADLPDPALLHGEVTPWAASERSRERGEPDAAGAVVRMFDKWIRLQRDEAVFARA